MNDTDVSRLESLYRQICGCRRCLRCDTRKIPKKVFEKYLESGLLILGQSLARDQVRCSGIPYHRLAKSASLPDNIPQLSRRSGEYLEKYLLQVGYTLSPQKLVYRLAYSTDIVKCYLGPKPNGKGDNKPRKEEIDNCEEWLLKEMALTKFRIVLLLGTPATVIFFQVFKKRTKNKSASQYYRKEESFRYGNSDIPVYVLPHPASMVKCKSNIYDETFDMIKEKLKSFSA